MKRFVVFIILLSILTLSVAWLANAALVVNSKHNLSYNLSTSGTGSIKSVDPALGGTSEVCVFCHTPHGGNTAAPLWNKTISVQSYVTYTSDVLAGLLYPGAENPNTHIKTKICLSCHDGTIALGSLVNLPYGASTQIPMEGTTGADVQYGMPTTAAGYIGLNLSDDHPVAIQHDSLIDTELVNGVSVGAAVRLYTAAGNKVNANNSYVECTSCHEPHNNAFGKFLVETNRNSVICIRCHTKTGFSGSVHADSTKATTLYAPPTGGLAPDDLHGPTVGDVKCMNCHFPHKAGVTTVAPTTPNPTSGTYLLSFQEEASCFNTGNDRWNTPGSNTVCHGSGAGTAARNVQTTENDNASRRHYTQDATRVGKHKATEGQVQGWLGLGNPNWHVECTDCHNPHTAGNTNHAATTNVVTAPTSPLYGAGGVSVSIYPTWTGTSGSYSYIQPIGVVNITSTGVDTEYKICFKCHSDFAWGIGAAPVSSGGYNLTDQAKEFNPGNTSHHPVIASNASTQGTYVTPWTNGSQTMYCSDCHTKESGNRPLGPHGSTNAYILNKAFDDTYSTTLSQTQLTSDLCFVCHNVDVYRSGSATLTGTGFMTTAGTNLHTRHRILSEVTGTGLYAYRCVNCHTRIPHGYSRKAMIVQKDDPAPYEAGGVGQGKITAATLATSGSYDTLKTTPDCTTVAGCHQ